MATPKTIQGTPLEAVYQQYVETGHLPLNLAFAGSPLERDPMMLAMNELGYDMMVVGNHEFNFGLQYLAKARSEARFPGTANRWRTTSRSGSPSIITARAEASGTRCRAPGARERGLGEARNVTLK